MEEQLKSLAVADLYIVLYDALVANPEKVGHGWEGIFYGENGEHSWYQISRAIGDALVKLGLCDEAEPTAFIREELVKYFGGEQWGWYNGANLRCRANRALSLGWKPKYTTEDMVKSILPEVETMWKMQKEGTLGNIGGLQAFESAMQLERRSRIVR